MRIVDFDNMAETQINVIGASGSGASTVGRSLASSLSFPHFDSDDYYHAQTDPPFRKPRSPEERYALMIRDLRCDKNWVLSGGVMGWTPCPKLKFTCIVFLYAETEVRIARLRRRERERFGSRILNGGDMHTTHEEFIDWASRYDLGDIDGKTLARHEEYLKAQNCPVLEFRGLMSVAEITRAVLRSAGDTECSV